MKTKIYEAADFFLVRTALLPFRQVAISPDSLFQFYAETPLFQEAIAIASPSLSSSLQEEADKEKLFPSLLKYFLRMSSRATPFGLFAAVGWGQFAGHANLELQFDALRRKAAPDGEWIQALINELHSQTDSVRPLKVMTNPNLIKKGGRVFLTEKKESVDTFSIKSTLVSDLIFSLSKTPILYGELENKLIARFDEHPKETVSFYLWQIFQKGYLLSECSSWLFGGIPHEANSLKIYEATPFGQGAVALRQAQTELKRDESIQHPIQVHSYYNNDSFRLPGHVKERAEEITDLLWHLTKSDRPPLETYQKQFHEKYGPYRFVPLLEAIDPHLGIGLPEIDSPKSAPSPFPWKRAVFSQLKNKILEIGDVQQKAPTTQELQKAPPSFELYFELLATSEKALEEEDYTMLISPMGSSLQAGSTFGRFLHLFQPAQKAQLCSFLEKEEAIDPGALFVEATFSPLSPRGANIANYEKTRNFQLEMHFHEPSQKSIELEDIYLGTTYDQLFLFSKKNNKRLYITLSSAANPLLTPPVLQFLLEVSKARFSFFSPFLWNGAENEEFLPRMVYKNVVLSPARWRLFLPSMGLEERPSQKSLKTALKSRLHALEVPDMVYLTDFDNRLLLNWTNETHFEILVQHLTKKPELLLYEALGTEENLCATSPYGKHVAEFVVPCVKRNAHQAEPLSFACSPSLPIEKKSRRFSPGSEWLYLKLFVARELEEDFLTRQLQPLVHSLTEKNEIEQWHYLRYKEEKSHLRLRLQSSPEKIPKILSTIHHRAQGWFEAGLLGDYSIHSYEREIERYGGPDAIQLAENVFCMDSACCLLALEKAPALEVPAYILGALGLINLVEGYYPTSQEQTRFLSTYTSNKQLLAGIRQLTPKAVKLGRQLLHGAESLFPQLKEAYCSTRIAVDALRNSELDDWNDKDSILQSLLHMHCNRLLGIDRDLEQKALVTAQYLLEKLHYQSSHEEALCKP